MGVSKVGGGGPIEEPSREAGLPELESVEGQRDEEAMRLGLERRHGGTLNRAAGVVDDVLSLVGVRPLMPRIPNATIRGLPSFEIEAKDGTRVSCELDEVEGQDGKKRPGVTFEWKPLGEPSLRFRSGEGLPRPLFGGLMREVPLALRHTFVARSTLDTIKSHLRAAEKPGAPLGPGATQSEVGAALSIASRVNGWLELLEQVVAKAPEARLAAKVYAGITSGKLKETAPLEKAIADLDRAIASIDGRTTLAPSGRQMVKEELGIVRRMADEWLHTSSRTGSYS